MQLRNRGAIVAAVALAAGALVGAAGAPAAASVPLTTQAQLAQGAAADRVSDSLGSKSAGYYLDSTGRAVVGVVDSASASKVRAAGLSAKQVKYTYSALLSTKTTLDQLRNVPQTAWGIDPSQNKVVVKILSAATPAVAKKVTDAAAKLGDRVTVVHQQGRNELYIRGGDAIQNGSARCSLGFNVTRNGEPFMLTAGHCTNLGGTWSGGDVSGGQVVESDCPGADSGLITRPNGTGPGEVNDGTQITSAANPTVGQSMKKSGSTTGITEGNITSVDESVNFDVGVLEHMTGAQLHSDHGDSGGTGYSGSAGQGTLSGGDTVTTYFYPLNRELQAYGLQLA
ncbi:S1 family peptidase [Fodinicola acaciae]|uniref:S1 family peptidase n=1 Tax=Fodinicola acaciae TaxID=2681555 RepID=UPI0013CF4D2E|nr:S1 family peptidase [Fodinicola acaciae]